MVRRRTATTLLLALLALAAACLLVLRGGSADAAGIGQLQQQIGAGQARISQLSGAIGAVSGRINSLGHGVAALQARVASASAALATQVAQLRQTQTLYTVTHARLVQLEAYDAHAETLLRVQVVASYEQQRPNLMTVILEARGFQDLLEQLSFASRIQRQDARVVSQVRSARRAVSAEAIRLGALAVRERSIADAILAQRDSLARAQFALIQQRSSLEQRRSAQSGQLASARSQVASLQRQLDAAQAAAARAAAAASGASASTGSGSGAAPSGGSFGAPSTGGGFTFPLPVSAASGPGSWSLDQGVDISAPGDTPEYAVCSGTIVLHGIGGFGPWAPVLHCDSPVGGYSYVYYGHAGPADQLPVGTHVGQGQVMSSVGPGIVGISTGPHLEIGFCDASGTPLGGGTASTMLSLLQSAYHG